MNEVTIDRMTLQMPGLSESEGRRLALLIAEGLGAVGGAGGGRDIPTMRIDLVAMPDTGADELARQVVAELIRQVRQLS